MFESLAEEVKSLITQITHDSSKLEDLVGLEHSVTRQTNVQETIETRRVVNEHLMAGFLTLGADTFIEIELKTFLGDLSS